MRPDWLWLFIAIQEIDFCYKDAIKESFLVSSQSNGGISFKELVRMDFDDYLFTVNYAYSLQNASSDGKE